MKPRRLAGNIGYAIADTLLWPVRMFFKAFWWVADVIDPDDDPQGIKEAREL